MKTDIVILASVDRSVCMYATAIDNHPSVCHSFPYFISFARQRCVRVGNAHPRAYIYLARFLSNEVRCSLSCSFANDPIIILMWRK